MTVEIMLKDGKVKTFENVLNVRFTLKNLIVSTKGNAFHGFEIGTYTNFVIKE